MILHKVSQISLLSSSHWCFVITILRIWKN